MRSIQTGLVIDEPWITKIVRGEKTWEMRSKPTTKRGRIALIKKGSGLIVGLATITGVLGPFTDDEIATNFKHHRVPMHVIGKWRFAWVLKDVLHLATPVPYVHNKGAVIWVNLDPAASSQVSFGM
jgi:hypothetical protein